MADEFPPPLDNAEPPLAKVPADIVREIVSSLRCKIDRDRARYLGETWRAQIQLLEPVPPPLPWLLVPRSIGPPVFHCVLSNWRTHRYFLVHSAHTARFFGSYDGNWLFVSLQQNDQHILLNLERPYLRIDLPNTCLRNFLVPPFQYIQILVEVRIFIVAATFSRQPTEPGCVAAGIIGYPPSSIVEGTWHIGFWEMGNQAPVISPSFPPINEDLEVEDLLYSRGDEAFLFLTRGEHIREFRQPIFPLPDMTRKVR
uniref:F-box domain-containing protein n=1 Tax=Oryza brachyantha TaxID=4533 RepID=J3ND21_ORYBR